MTPLERMAKAHWAESENCRWENLTDEDRAHLINVMRSALLALSEGELPRAMANEAQRIYWYEGDDNDDGAKRMEGCFKAIIRAIAEEKTQ